MRVVVDLREASRLGGVEVTVLEDSRALVALGHDVHVVHGPDRDGTGDLRPDFEAAGVTLHGPHQLLWRPKRTPVDLAAYTGSARLLRRLRPDVVWLQRFEHALWAQAATSLTRTPVVCHLHHSPNYRRAVQRVLATGIRRFLAVSDFTRDQWIARGLSADRVGVVHNALPPGGYARGGEREAVEARRRLGVDADAEVLLFYGWLTREKGVDTLLEAWRSLAADHPAAHLLLAARTPAGAGEAVTRALAAGVAAGRVTWLPFQRDVVPLLHAADVVLFPTVAPEAFGRVALEALATGRPVVASRVGAVPEVLTGALERLLVPPGDARALADAAGGLLRWRRTEPELGLLCADGVDQRFDHSARMKTVVDELSRAARER